MLEQRDRKLLERERELDKAKEDLAKAMQEQVVALERVSGMSAEDAKAMLLEAVRGSRPSTTPSSSPGRSSGPPARRRRTRPATSS